MDRVSTTSEHEGDSGVESTHSSGESFVYIRVSVPELNLQVFLSYTGCESISVAWISDESHQILRIAPCIGNVQCRCCTAGAVSCPWLRLFERMCTFIAKGTC
jgi:hypothetical protein